MPPVPPIPLLKRRARLLARCETVPLHAALDRIAQAEGYARWSLLAAYAAEAAQPAASLPPLLPSFDEGDLLLIAARPGQGKTLLGLRLLVEAAETGRRAVFFTLEYTEADTQARLAKLRGGAAGSQTTALRGSVGSSAGGIEIVASDDISATTIAAHLEAAPRGTVAVIDYLQILDQDRRKPPLGEQVEALRQLARTRGLVLAVLSQIDRRFDATRGDLPTMDDVRLPNPVAMAAFTKTCFLHAGQVRFGNDG